MSTSIEGRIAVDVSFADKSETSGVQSLKKILLSDTTAYTTGKVAIVTGTVGTAVATIYEAGVPTTYKDSAGNAVTFTSGPSVNRLVFSSDKRVEFFVSASDARLSSESNRVAMTCLLGGGADQITAQAMTGTAGTASYTLVLYGT